jgi:hypothetical protein
MRLLLIATLLLASVSGFAKSPRAAAAPAPMEMSSSMSSGSSYFFWQAGAGKSYLLPELSYTKISATLKPAGDFSEKSTGIQVSYEYGWNEDISVGATLGYSKDKLDNTGTSSTNSGVEDLKFYLKGTRDLAPGNLKYGASLNLSPGKNKTETNGDSNEFTGRHSITPYVGYEMKANAFTFGGKLSYELAITDEKSEDATGAETKTGGDTSTEIALFGESSCSFGRWGASLTHLMTSKSKPAGGTESSNPTADTLDIYGDHNINDTTTLTGTIGYAKIGSSDNIDSGHGIHLALGARVNF